MSRIPPRRIDSGRFDFPAHAGDALGMGFSFYETACGIFDARFEFFSSFFFGMKPAVSGIRKSI
jgi:hypothetical protein